MKAVVFDQFQQRPTLREVPDPVPGPHSVVVQVQANGICRSDWHAWMGHDSTVQLPHVPGHEMAGVVHQVGAEIERFRVGDRVTVPFACGCGGCRYCQQGQLHICDHDFQPGFTHWGAFAQLVEIHYADTNLVALPDQLDFVTAASLGCRFATAYRALVGQGKLSTAQWLVVHGSGGLGLSCVMIAKALGANVIAVDVQQQRLQLASQLGADHALDGTDSNQLVTRVLELTGGGADVSVDALGSRITASNSIQCLRKQGRHVQAGLLLGDQADPPLPMGRVISHELTLLGSHGMSATDYPAMLDLVSQGRVQPQQLIGQQIELADAADALVAMGEFQGAGVTVISNFG